MPRHPKMQGTQGFPSLRFRQEYQPLVAAHFPSLSSLDWYIRRNRSELAACGAIVKIRNEVLIDEDRFPDAVKRIGAKLAAVEPK